jgi:hypothetical protein
MLRLRLPLLLSVPLAAGALVLASGPAAWAATTNLSASAKGTAEAGKPGNTTASAAAAFTADPASGQFCFTVTATGLDDAVAMHIHKGAAGVNGPVVIPFDAKKIGAGKTCVQAAPALVGQIVANPSGYYFNVHTPAFPAGAVRGQLVASSSPAKSPAKSSAKSPTKVNAGSGGGAADSGGLPMLPALLVLLGLGLAGAGWRLARR